MDFVIIESYCEAIVSYLNNGGETWRNEAAGILRRCGDILNSLEHVKLVHVRRAGNNCAHYLAKFLSSLDSEMIWVNE